MLGVQHSCQYILPALQQQWQEAGGPALPGLDLEVWPLSHVTCMMSRWALPLQGCSILVAGRVADDGTFMTLADIELPKLMQEQVRDNILRA